MKKRDQYGRFIDNMKPEFYNVLDVCTIIYRLIPLLIIALIAYRYFDFPMQISKFFMDVACGSRNCTCSCPALASAKQNGL